MCREPTKRRRALLSPSQYSPLISTSKIHAKSKYCIFLITTANCTWGGIFLHKLQLSSCTKVPVVSYFYNHHTRALDDNSKQQQIIARPTTKTKIISFNTLKWSIFQWLILNIPLLTIADQNIWIIEIGAKWMNKWKWV